MQCFSLMKSVHAFSGSTVTAYITEQANSHSTHRISCTSYRASLTFWFIYFCWLLRVVYAVMSERT